MRTELTRLMQTGLVLCSLALLSTVFVAGCTEPSSPEPAPSTAPVDSRSPDSDASSSQDSGGSGTQGGGSSSR